ncbi:formate dehydrogenase subunit alpha [Limnohabitans sp. MMS-10A-160]|uniref:formate dehydrogenase subunit alpha n=1 Tax=unclassified Limnohabitans TaxID=2626134 RepID=UPI000D37030B|nr:MULTISPECIES: formate dehydrogenase subunit alpha [unclassified Limnohabitans]PUE19662.1 formate dehydrogenase subunit alpha [Limnohabitans sp. MMS-10A-192]PUE27023.1 formate dehydrogenase subunit alpha [Limnohabitans sp. MMS-10A-160]
MSTVQFSLNGQSVEAPAGKSIFNIAKELGIAIPHLCHKEGLAPDGNCRACVVEIDGERTLAPSCCRSATSGMKVQTNSERAVKSQKMVLEMLLADLPEQGHKWLDDRAEAPHGELSQWAEHHGVQVRPALAALKRDAVPADLSHPAMAVNLDACIQCNRCERACRDLQVNDVIGLAFRGAHTQVVFDLADPMGGSSCVGCGECVQACPTGALMPKSHMGPQKVDREVDSVCPFCGVGCLVTYQVKDEKIISVQGREGPANEGRLCVKGRFGMDYIHSPDRITQPLIRKTGVAKDVSLLDGHTDWREVFREATWEEALDLATQPLNALRQAHGPKSLAGFGSAKGSNEEAYLFQKLVRTGFGSNNVDHCTRLCHASSVAALLEGVGSGAVSNPVRDVEHSDLIIVIGSNPTANHPVAASWMKNAAQRGTRIVLADPRITDIGRHTWRNLQFKPDTDVALLNAMLHVIVHEGLCNEQFLKERADNVAELKAHVQDYTPEAMSAVCGIPADTIREVARAYATAKAAMILWGMGVSQHVHGTDNVRCLIALASITGQIGRPGTGLHPLRGQNNVQGASDAGLIPMMYPNYQRVSDKSAHDWFEKFWDTKLDDQPGYTVVEIMHKALASDSDPHKVRGMYIMGENPAMSDPDLNHARHALASLQHLVVQDIFLTETAWLADVVLPASAWPEKAGTVSNTDRTVQMGRQAVLPPGDAKPDLWIIQQIAERMGLNWRYAGEHDGVAEVYEEMRQAMAPAIGGIDWARLNAGSVTYPCVSADDPGQPIVFHDHFPTADGRVRLVPASLIPANEQPDAEYPMVLITGRQLEHWHTGSMTRRATVLDALEPAATASMHAADMARLGLQPGQRIRVASRRGHVELAVRQDNGTPLGAVFIPFAYVEAAANELTNAALDPFGKIPEFKYCAVQIQTLTLTA